MQKTQEPYVRLLACRTCKTIEELPGFEGKPEDDVLLNYLVERHGPTHVGVLYNVGYVHWNSPTMRPQIVQQINDGGSSGLDVFGTHFYETRDTFREDALVCFGQHLRPKEQCPDFRSSKKLLKPDTDKERREIGLPTGKKSGGPKVYLCDFCPVRMYNARKFNEEMGIDK